VQPRPARRHNANVSHRSSGHAECRLRPSSGPTGKVSKMAKEFERPLSVLLRTAFIGCIIVLALLAWLPGPLVARTMLGGHSEHFVAYLVTAISMGLTFQRSPRLPVQCFLLIMYAAVLEMGQVYSPGRHASFQDFAYSGAGVVAGTLLLSMARARLLSWLGLD
jgi:VanZ family protein